MEVQLKNFVLKIPNKFQNLPVFPVELWIFIAVPVFQCMYVNNKKSDIEAATISKHMTA